MFMEYSEHLKGKPLIQYETFATNLVKFAYVHLILVFQQTAATVRLTSADDVKRPRPRPCVLFDL